MEGEAAAAADFPPNSPGVAQVELESCLVELMKFVLSSSIEETLEIELGLSKDYCSDLLKSDDLHGSDVSEGYPNYPLYKCLASALHHCLVSGEFSRNSDVTVISDGGECMKKKEYEWNKLVLEKGSELVEMLRGVDFELHVQEPFFTQLKDGVKTIEGRCAYGDYNRIGPGALILFNKCLLLEVQDIKRYVSFSEMLKAENVEKFLPGIKTVEDGVQIYRKFYTEEKEKSNGVVGICVLKQASQPYISLATILSGLGDEGIGRLLGLMHTVGTVPDALPPPRTVLLSSFMKTHKPNVR